MLRTTVLAAVASLCLLAASKEAAAQDRVTKDASNYCEWVKSSATSQAAPLLMPALFVSGGVVGGPDAGDGASSLPPTGRVTAGASYSVSGLFRGMAIGDRADSECALYRSEVVIRSFVQAYRDGDSKAALTAALGVYQAAEPKAQEMYERVSSAASAGRATAVELTEAAMRLDDLRSRSVRARTQLDALGKKSVPSPKELSTALAAQPGLEAEVERSLARVRKTSAWDLSVRGGYDRFFGVRDHVPLFVTATLTINTGLLFQFGADSRAVEARKAWAATQIEGPNDRAAQVATKLAALRAEARARLEQTVTLSNDLELRHKTLESLGTDGARMAASTVWFALVHAKAERAFYAALAADLDVALNGSH